MNPFRYRASVIALVCTALAAAPALAQTQTKQGQGGSVVKGAAGTEGRTDGGNLEHCAAPMGAMAVVEPQDAVLVALTRYNLRSPVGLIRLMIQQSNCFIVVERGVGMSNMMQERALASGGELRQNSNMGGGQMVAADFLLTPNVVFSENNAGGVGGAVGGLFGHKAAAVGAVAAKSSTYLAFGHRDFMSRRAARSLPASASARPARPRGVVITSAMPNGQG